MMFGWCWRSDQYELYQVYQVSDTKTDEGTLQLDIKHLFPNIWYENQYSYSWTVQTFIQLI